MSSYWLHAAIIAVQQTLIAAESASTVTKDRVLPMFQLQCAGNSSQVHGCKARSYRVCCVARTHADVAPGPLHAAGIVSIDAALKVCTVHCLQIARYESTVERLSTELGSTRQEQDQLQSELAEAQTRNEQLQADLESSQEQVYSQIADYKSQIDQLQEQLQEARSDVSSLQQQQESAEASYAKLQSTQAAEQASASEEVANLRQEAEQLQQQLTAEREKANGAQQAELAQQVQRVSELEAQLQEGVAERARLEEDYGYALQEAGQREDALREEVAAAQVLYQFLLCYLCAVPCHAVPCRAVLNCADLHHMSVPPLCNYLHCAIDEDALSSKVYVHFVCLCVCKLRITL